MRSLCDKRIFGGGNTIRISFSDRAYRICYRTWTCISMEPTKIYRKNNLWLLPILCNLYTCVEHIVCKLWKIRIRLKVGSTRARYNILYLHVQDTIVSKQVQTMYVRRAYPVWHARHTYSTSYSAAITYSIGGIVVDSFWFWTRVSFPCEGCILRSPSMSMREVAQVRNIVAIKVIIL